MPRQRVTVEWAAGGAAMRRRDFLALLGAGAAGLFAPGLRAAVGDPDERRPNIIVIVADDLGYADLGCQGGTDIPTPHIDSLAQSGVRFTNGYVSCPVCSPTRAGVMTGRYQQRFGHEFNPGAAQRPGAAIGLPLSEFTIADALKQAGYVTGAVGKWHLGMEPQFHPLRRGFDEFFGFLGGGHSYLNAQADPRNPILRGTEVVEEKEYLTDAFSREAVDFVARHHQEPFFLYLCYNAVHTPLEATPRYLDPFSGIADPKRRTYAAMLSAMDDGIGALLAKLRELRLDDNTLLFFFSDNGGPTMANGSSNAPLNGVKGTLYEGGIRVPFILRWPARIGAGTTYDHPVIALDVFPTAAAAAGAQVPHDRVMDGVNLIPHLTGADGRPPHDLLFWRIGQQRAVRRGEWKLARLAAGDPLLFNLAQDIGESTNLAQAQPELVRELGEALAQWESGLAQPLWGRPQRPLRRRLAPRRARRLRSRL